MHRAFARDGGKQATRDRIWPVLLAVTVVAGVAALRWLLSDSVVPWDSKNQFHAFFRFLAESLHAGTTPFWNPYHYGGHPSIADPQSLVFSPAFLLWAWFDRNPGLYVVDLIELLHLLAGGLAMAWLGARRDWPPAASLLAAAVFMLGGAASARLNHTGIILAYGLFPVAVAALEAALARRSMLLAIATGFVASMILTGRNQVSLLLMMALAAWAVVLLVRAEQPMEYLRRHLAVLVVAGVVTIALSAVPVLLTMQLASLSNRPESTLKEALEGSLYPPSLATLAVANVFGAHAPNWGYWGPNWARLPEVAATDETFTYMFVGAVPVLLLGWMGLAGRRLLGRGGVLLAALGITLLFALGRYTPLFPFAFENVPGISFFRRPVDALFLFEIGIAIVSGHLLAGYVRRGLPTPDPLLTALVLAAATAVLCGAIAFSARSGRGFDATFEILRAGAIMGVAAAILYWGRHVERRQWAAAAAVALAVGELLWWNAGSRMNAEPRRVYQSLETATGDDARAIAVLSAEMNRRRREGAQPRVEVIGIDGPWQNIAMILKLEATTGYNPLRIGAYDRYVGPGERPYLLSSRRFPPTFENYDCALARSLGIEYLVLGRPLESLTHLRRRPVAEVLLAGPKVWIYRLQRGAPRVRFTPHIRVADADRLTRTGEFANQPSLENVLIDDDTPPQLPKLRPVALWSDGDAEIVSWRPGRVRIRVDAPVEGAVVLNDLYYPGWVAEVDGKPVQILRADVLFRAVQVPRGASFVEFRYEPLSTANLWAAARQVAGGR